MSPLPSPGVEGVFRQAVVLEAHCPDPVDDGRSTG